MQSDVWTRCCFSSTECRWWFDPWIYKTARDKSTRKWWPSTPKGLGWSSFSPEQRGNQTRWHRGWRGNARCFLDLLGFCDSSRNGLRRQRVMFAKKCTKLLGLNDSKWFWMWLSQTLIVPKSPIPYSKLVWCIMGPAPSWSSGWCPNRKQSPSDHPGPCRACRACCAWRQFPGGRGEGFETKPAMHSWALTKNTVGWLYYMA